MLVKFVPAKNVEKDILHLQKRLGLSTVSKTVQAVLSHYDSLLNDYKKKCLELDEANGLYDELTNDVGVFLESRRKLDLHFKD